MLTALLSVDPSLLTLCIVDPPTPHRHLADSVVVDGRAAPVPTLEVRLATIITTWSTNSSAVVYYIIPLQVEALAAGMPAEDAIEHTIKSVRPRHGPRDIRLASDYRIFYWQAEEGPILAIVAPTAMLLAIAEALKVSSGFEPRRIALRCDDKHSEPTLLALWQPKGGDVVWLQELFAKSDHYGALLDAVPAAAGDSEGGAFGPSRGGHALRAAAQVP